MMPISLSEGDPPSQATDIINFSCPDAWNDLIGKNNNKISATAKCACSLSFVFYAFIPFLYITILMILRRHQHQSRRRRYQSSQQNKEYFPLAGEQDEEEEVGNVEVDHYEEGKQLVLEEKGVDEAAALSSSTCLNGIGGRGGGANGPSSVSKRGRIRKKKGVVKSVGLLYVRESLLLVHLIYQAFMLLVQLDDAMESAGSLWWQHSLVLRVLMLITWSIVLWMEEKLFRNPRQRTLPRSLVGFYALAAISSLLSTLLVAAATNGNGHSILPKLNNPEFWDAFLIIFLLFPSALVAMMKSPAITYYDHVSPDMNTGLLTFVMFTWCEPMILASRKRIKEPRIFSNQKAAATAGKKDRKKKAEEVLLDANKDIPDMADDDLASHESKRLLALRLKYPKDSLWQSVFRLVGWTYIMQFLYRLISSATMFAAPLALRILVSEVGKHRTGEPINMTMWACVLVMFVGPSVNAIGDTQTWSLGRRMGCACRGAVSSLIMRKALRLDVLSEGSVGAGELTNLLAVDAQSLLELMVFSHMIVGGIEVLLITVILLFQFLGLSSIAGLALILITTPLNSFLQTRMKKLQALIMKRKDVRMARISEVLYGVKIIKLFVWETNFASVIDTLRDLELKALSSFVALMSIATVILRGSPTLVALVTFVFHVKVLNKELDAAGGFASLALFNLLRFPLMALPEALNHVGQARVSMQRVERFLQRREVPGRKPLPSSSSSSSHQEQAALPIAAEIEHGYFTYSTFQFLSAATPPPSPFLPAPPTDHSRRKGRRRSRGNSLDEPLLGPLRESSSSSIYEMNDIDGNDEEEERIQQRRWMQEEEDEEEESLSFVDREEVREEGGGASSSRSSSCSSLLVLRDILIGIPKGGLTIIYGPTGGGKTSLLMALLGEIITVHGGCQLLTSNGPTVGSHVAYVSQKAWILNATLRENIVFGHPWDEQRYWQVIGACALESDLLSMAAGDATEIGEKGVNLSGGQCQRVNLARALYAGAEIIIMDDVLSAVDAPVAEHLYHEAIQGFLQGTTRVLVTHQTSLTLPGADHVIVVEDGRIAYTGPVDDAPLDDHHAHNHYQQPQQEETSSSPSSLDGSRNFSDNQEERQKGALGGKGGGGGSLSNSLMDLKALNDHHHSTAQQAIARLTKDEGALSSSTKNKMLVAHWEYFKACGYHILICLVVFTVGFQGLNVIQSLFLKDWLRAMRAGKDGPQVDGEMWKFIGTCLGSLTCLLLRAWIVENGSVAASRYLHETLIRRVLRAPMSWFDMTPIGRVLNRFSNDFQTIDREVMAGLIRFLDMILSLVGVTAISIASIPQMAIAMVFVLPLAYYISLLYLSVSRPLKRFESAARSPVYAHFAEAVSGIVTIRAYESEMMFLERLHTDIDEANRMHYYLWMSNYWMSTRLRFLGAVVAGCTALAVVLLAVHGGIDNAVAGLALTYALPFSQAVVFSIRTHSELEMNMNSVERVMEYLHIEQEAAPTNKDYRPPSKGWPSQGEVSVQSLVVRYRKDLDPVLKGITFHVPPRTKVGIVGRTGSGKSTFMMALLRITEPESGHLLIDGWDTLRMGLADLRQGVAVIPQEPSLFEGTIRSNLDIFGQNSDAELWEVLRKVRLEGAITMLDQEVSESGSNLSVGERQMLCFARALLKQTPLIIMDEATANIDPRTDAAIQETIRVSFNHATVLCIAHRLHTVMYYDRVLVLDNGSVLEYDTPINLLRKADSRLRAMGERTGDLSGLMQIALEAQESQEMNK